MMAVLARGDATLGHAALGCCRGKKAACHALDLRRDRVERLGEGSRHCRDTLVLRSLLRGERPDIVFQRRDPAFRAWLDDWLLRRKFAGTLVAKVETARLARTLGTLLRNGVPLMTALGIGRNVLGNRVLADDVEKAAEEVKNGVALSTKTSRVDPCRCRCCSTRDCRRSVSVSPVP